MHLSLRVAIAFRGALDFRGALSLLLVDCRAAGSPLTATLERGLLSASEGRAQLIKVSRAG